MRIKYLIKVMNKFLFNKVQKKTILQNKNYKNQLLNNNLINSKAVLNKN